MKLQELSKFHAYMHKSCFQGMELYMCSPIVVKVRAPRLLNSEVTRVHPGLGDYVYSAEVLND